MYTNIFTINDSNPLLFFSLNIFITLNILCKMWKICFAVIFLLIHKRKAVADVEFGDTYAI